MDPNRNLQIDEEAFVAVHATFILDPVLPFITRPSPQTLANMFASTLRPSAVKTLYQNVLKEAERSVRICFMMLYVLLSEANAFSIFFPSPSTGCAQAKSGPLVSYLQKEYKDAESGTIAAHPKPAGDDYTPFIPPSKSPAQLREEDLENLHVFLQNKALHAVSTSETLLGKPNLDA